MTHYTDPAYYRPHSKATRWVVLGLLVFWLGVALLLAQCAAEWGTP